MDLIRQTLHCVFFHPVKRCLVAAGYRSRHPNWCPKLTPDHCRHHMLSHMDQNWNHQHWSHVLFVDGFIFSPYNCNGRAQRPIIVQAESGLLIEYGPLTRYVILLVARAGNTGSVFPTNYFKGNCYLAIPAYITARGSRTRCDACRDRDFAHMARGPLKETSADGSRF